MDPLVAMIGLLGLLQVASFTFMFQMSRRLDGLIKEMNRRFDQVNLRIDALIVVINGRFDDVNRRIDETNLRIDGLIVEMNRRFDDVNGRFDDAAKRDSDVEQRVSHLEGQASAAVQAA